MAVNNIQPLRPYMEFVGESRQLTKEAYDFLNNMFIRVGGSLSELNAAMLQDKTWEEPGTIGSITPNTGAFTTLSATGAASIGSDLTLTNGNMVISGTGKGVQIKGGANGRIGRATLVAGTVVVANTTVTANTNIYLTCRTPGGTPGFLRVSAITNGVSFTILSSSGTDTSIVNWLLVEQIP